MLFSEDSTCQQQIQVYNIHIPVKQNTWYKYSIQQELDIHIIR
jgi:hypothetical protein